jgi:hypothetical protein
MNAAFQIGLMSASPEVREVRHEQLDRVDPEVGG